ncbi:TetR family transcriptional regulator [Streptomyces sp. NPDC056004]
MRARWPRRGGRRWRDGFDGVRIADIAAHAGVFAALVHYHFTGR